MQFILLGSCGPKTVLNCFRRAGFVSTTENAGLMDIDVLAYVLVPDNLTAEGFEAIVEFDSHLETESEFTGTELLEMIAVVKLLQAEAQEDSALDDGCQSFRNSYRRWTFSAEYRGFEKDYEAARKIEKDLQVEVANNKKKITMDKLCSEKHFCIFYISNIVKFCTTLLCVTHEEH